MVSMMHRFILESEIGKQILETPEGQAIEKCVRESEGLDKEVRKARLARVLRTLGWPEPRITEGLERIDKQL